MAHPAATHHGAGQSTIGAKARCSFANSATDKLLMVTHCAANGGWSNGPSAPSPLAEIDSPVHIKHARTRSGDAYLFRWSPLRGVARCRPHGRGGDAGTLFSSRIVGH